VAPETLRDLSDRLSALLTDIDIAVRVRLRESEKQAGERRRETARRDTWIRSALTSTLRWLTHPAGGPSSARRTRSAHERAREPGRGSP